VEPFFPAYFFPAIFQSLLGIPLWPFTPVIIPLLVLWVIFVIVFPLTFCSD
jgi:hypothetical protein